MSVEIIHAKMELALPQMEPESFHACVTDPPYHLTNVDFRKTGSGNARKLRQIRSAGFMNQAWDGGDVAFQPETWAEVYRVLKPGAYLLAFGGTRTFHRLACAVEDAGFEIRDTIMWLYGSGFPKSHDVSKAIDRARDDYEDVCRVALWLRPHVERAGFDVVTEHFGFKDQTMARARWTSKSQPQVPTWEQWLQLKVLCDFGDEMDAEVWRLNGRKGQPGEAWFDRELIGLRENGYKAHYGNSEPQSRIVDITAPATEAARAWQGWGTALKPACELICVARKPLDSRPERVELTPEVLATWEAKRCDHA